MRRSIRSMSRTAGTIGPSSGNSAAPATDDPRYTAAEFPPSKLLYLAASVFGTPYASITPPCMWGMEWRAKF
jgi:hypothetical protein